MADSEAVASVGATSMIIALVVNSFIGIASGAQYTIFASIWRRLRRFFCIILAQRHCLLPATQDDRFSTLSSAV